MQVFAKHRNGTLAERHRVRLERELDAIVWIHARRNANDEESPRGHYFEYRGRANKREEYAVKFSSTTGKDKRPVMIDVRIFVSGKRTQQEMLDAVAEVANGYSPREWMKIKTIDWARNDEPEAEGKGTQRDLQLLGAIVNNPGTSDVEVVKPYNEETKKKKRKK